MNIEASKILREELKHLDRLIKNDQEKLDEARNTIRFFGNKLSEHTNAHNGIQQALGHD